MQQRQTLNNRYQIDRPVGKGGMAVVYRGHDLLLERPVAIKILRPQYAADATFRERFEREAQAAAGFSHANIVDIYDVGEEAGIPYIVMAFIQGQTLKEIIAREGPFHPDDVAELLGQIASALDYAHQRGYVHRDVKPQNILVDQRGHAVVADFGIAKGLDDADLTEVGTGLGTVHYLSPEQARGLMATPASDIYAMAVIAFEMVTGRLPFTADSAVAVAVRHADDAPPTPSSFYPTVPAPVDAIVLRGLQKDPTRRYASAGAFANAMRQWREMRSLAGDDQSTADPNQIVLPRELSTRGNAAPGIPQPVGREAFRGGAASDRDDVELVPNPRSRDEVGCVTWMVGTLILGGLIGLIWVGFRLSPRFDDFGLVGRSPGEPTQLAAPPVAPPPPVAPTIAQSDGEPTLSGPEPEPVTVPNVVGMTLDQAIDAANRRGLVIEQLDPIFSAAVPVDEVVEQEPLADTVLEQGQTITVRLSRGDDRIDLAALGLVGREADVAEAMLSDLGLQTIRVETASETMDPGVVVGVNPPGWARPRDVVTLAVSAGDLVRIPAEIQGQPLPQVRRQLERLGLVIGLENGVDQATIENAGIDLPDAGIQDGDVVGVQGEGIDSGAWVPRGTTVDINFFDRSLGR